MDETTRTHVDTNVDTHVDTHVEQATLPFEQLPPVALPFDDEADRPIAFGLTARARREVAPEALPPLSVVADGDLDHPGDTRPSRARALRRAGVGTEDIARQLAVDELVVRAWTGDVAQRPSSRTGTRGGVSRTGSTEPPVLRSVTGRWRPAPAGAPVGQRDEVSDQVSDHVSDHEHDHDVAFDLARAAAVEDARRRLGRDPAFAAGAGMLAAAVTVDHHAVTMATDRRELAAAVLRWLREQAALHPGDVRVVLRLDRAVAADLERHRWAGDLGLPVERVAHTRRPGGTRSGAADALLRIHAPSLAAMVAGWCDAVLHPAADPADVAF